MVNGNKQDFNLYTEDYMKNNKPKCSICEKMGITKLAVGMYRNSDDKEIRLCDDCVTEKFNNNEI